MGPPLSGAVFAALACPTEWDPTVLLWETYQTITEVNKNKGTSGNIFSKAPKTDAREICVPVTDCLKSAMVFFLNELKLLDKISP